MNNRGVENLVNVDKKLNVLILLLYYYATNVLGEAYVQSCVWYNYATEVNQEFFLFFLLLI